MQARPATLAEIKSYLEKTNYSAILSVTISFPKDGGEAVTLDTSTRPELTIGQVLRFCEAAESLDGVLILTRA
jgi:hypothetical protein